MGREGRADSADSPVEGGGRHHFQNPDLQGEGPRREDESLPASRVGPQGRGAKALERAELFFGCLIFFAGLFYLTREAKTDAQWYFRVVSFLVGAAGWAVVQLLKRRAARRGRGHGGL